MPSALARQDAARQGRAERPNGRRAQPALTARRTSGLRVTPTVCRWHNDKPPEAAPAV
jgi:hypothetical protein